MNECNAVLISLQHSVKSTSPNYCSENFIDPVAMNNC